MSASLVGSEMCIRDRLQTSPSTAAARSHPSQTCAEQHTPFLRGLASVSYTHLTLPTICSV
eukprot:12554738-Alexandrium_andersonii.AAC.1